jgi:hypothetical protein
LEDLQHAGIHEFKALFKDSCEEAAETCGRRFLKMRGRKFVKDSKTNGSLPGMPVKIVSIGTAGAVLSVAREARTR